MPPHMGKLFFGFFAIFYSRSKVVNNSQFTSKTDLWPMERFHHKCRLRIDRDPELKSQAEVENRQARQGQTDPGGWQPL
jgi:hypothetical protein